MSPAALPWLEDVPHERRCFERDAPRWAERWRVARRRQRVRLLALRDPRRASSCGSHSHGRLRRRFDQLPLVQISPIPLQAYGTMPPRAAHTGPCALARSKTAREKRCALVDRSNNCCAGAAFPCRSGQQKKRARGVLHEMRSQPLAASLSVPPSELPFRRARCGPSFLAGQNLGPVYWQSSSE